MKKTQFVFIGFIVLVIAYLLSDIKPLAIGSFKKKRFAKKTDQFYFKYPYRLN